MLDFVRICSKTTVKKSETAITIFPEFLVGNSEDLMVRGGAFYAVWDERSHLWSKDPKVVCEIIDGELKAKASEYPDDVNIDIKYMRTYSSKKWNEFLSYCQSLSDNFHELDDHLTFMNEEPVKSDYASKSLPYSLSSEPCESYDELMSVLYSPDERQKLEWAIGSVVAGDSKYIQKFIVLYGEAGSGKSTVLNIVQKLFDGYYNIFDARALGTAGNNFSLEVFRNNPLVSIQHDGDLSRIEDNTRLNSIVAHEKLVVNEKRKTQYESYFHTMLFMGTNKPVRITDAKSGIVRRLLDVRPSGDTIPFSRYQTLMSRIGFELGSIAAKCLRVYTELGREAYDSYKPQEMIGETNDFFNYVEDHYDIFAMENYTTLAEAWTLYKRWCEDSGIKYPLSKRLVKNELKSYFEEYHERKKFGDEYKRNVYTGFLREKVFPNEMDPNTPRIVRATLTLDETKSIFDVDCADCQAQYANSRGTPSVKWDDCNTKLSDIDTSELHYVRVPENHIVIDFDLTDDEGNKDLTANLRAASKWPQTYAEYSKSGSGVHLHYIYDGDVSKLASKYSDGIEIKVFKGNSSLRRKLTKCNRRHISHILSGLPLKKGGKASVINFEGIKNEKALRTLIKRNLNKEIHPGTKPSVEFIFTCLNEAYESGIKYDVSDMEPAVIAFANNSTHHSLYCLKLVNQMKWKSEEPDQGVEWSEQPVTFYDVEVFPNLFVVVWKTDGTDQIVKLINPTPDEIEMLCRLKLVGFNNRRYDNHILYGRLIGYDNEQLYRLSKSIVSGSRNAMFREAYNLSYADIYDFSSKKQSLKKFEIELGIHHQELGLPWDKPVTEDLWGKVADYCVNDVVATEAVFKARHSDFVAREILAKISGLKVNDTTRMHTTRIIFGRDRHPQSQFVYTDLSTEFPGYKFESGTSTYRGEVTGEGGYVYSEPGMYEDVALLDVESMHPNSLIQLNLFGDKYTKRFKELLDTRLAIKHGRYDEAREMFGGELEPYLKSDDDAKQLSYALKIVINSVYGLTSAKFDCEFRDPRNVDNIVAKRGALFMIDLKHEIQDRGYTVAHIKTDSVKIPNADPEIIRFVMDYGKRYGYNFEHEATYSKLCLVNDAVYVAKEKDTGKWTATGAQFQVPYIFKTLFSKEELEFSDFCETKTVTGESALYLDRNERLRPGEHDYEFVGRAGSFCPMVDGVDAGLLMREKGGKYYAAAGTKGYRWLESEVVHILGLEDKIDVSYYQRLAEEAIDKISQYGDFEWFVKE